jgi:haloalkane dehalogenase
VDELDLREATVVVQDWGGPIGLRLAVERTDRIGRLVLLNTGIGGGRPPSEEWLRFRAWVRKLGTEMIPGRLVQLSAVQPIAEEVVEGAGHFLQEDRGAEVGRRIAQFLASTS